MKVALVFDDLDEVLELADRAIDAHPDQITLDVVGVHAGKPEHLPHKRATCDEDLTLDDISLFDAGQLNVYRQFMSAGLITIRDVANIMEFKPRQICDAFKHWDATGVVAQRDIVREIYISLAEDAEDEEE